MIISDYDSLREQIIRCLATVQRAPPLFWIKSDVQFSFVLSQQSETLDLFKHSRQTIRFLLQRYKIVLYNSNMKNNCLKCPQISSTLSPAIKFTLWTFTLTRRNVESHTHSHSLFKELFFSRGQRNYVKCYRHSLLRNHLFICIHFFHADFIFYC